MNQKSQAEVERDYQHYNWERDRMMNSRTETVIVSLFFVGMLIICTAMAWIVLTD